MDRDTTADTAMGDQTTTLAPETTSTSSKSHHQRAADAAIRQLANDGSGANKPVRVFITGYGAFQNVGNNPTTEIAERLKTMKFSGAIVQVRVLPVTWKDVDAAVDGEIKAFQPDIVISMGFAAGRHEIKEFAINKREGTDAAGVEKTPDVISANGPAVEKSTLPIDRIENDQRKLKSKGLSVRDVAEADDDYLCNYIEYRTLQTLAGTNAEVGFLHVSNVKRDTSAAKRAIESAIADVRARRKDAKPDAGSKAKPPGAATNNSKAVDPAIRAKTEAVLGTSLDGVRIHTDLAAQQAAHALGARAFTTGQDIYFAAGQYDPTSEDGQLLIAHELAHTVQQRSGTSVQTKLVADTTGDRHEQEADAVASHAVTGGGSHAVSSSLTGAVQRKPEAPSPKDPRQFPTYEGWIAAFSSLPTFSSVDTTPAGAGQNATGFSVVGQAATAQSPGATPDRPAAGEKYIDHPALAWLKANLPDELIASVYTLPADCADTAICLRHVWLFAHGRTEKYGAWTIGVGAGATPAARSAVLRDLLVEKVYSGSVSAMVSSAYGGVRSFPKLEPMLHVGDVLVWEHHDPDHPTKRIGGHTQTIQTITRDDSGKIVTLTCLEGNQPINEPEAEDIQREQTAEKKKPESSDELRNLPGRRIERSEHSGSELADNDKGVWTWNDPNHTTLVAAGPPAAASRPPAGKDPTTHAPKRQLSDWFPQVTAATGATVQGVFEAALYEVRAAVDAGTAVTPDNAKRLGMLAGQRASALGAKDTADSMLAEVKAMASSPATQQVAAQVATTFNLIAQAFSEAYNRPKA